MPHLLDTDKLPVEEISALFHSADELAHIFRNKGALHELATQKRSFIAAFLFMEPSTRTRMSFEVALERLGGRAVHLGEVGSSSLAKGESLEDTFWTAHAMRPDLIVVRSGEQFPLEDLVKLSSVPVINAGHGGRSHPTQALLDLYTLHREWPDLSGKRVLFVGDLKHSRVIRSNFQLFARYPLELGVCGPEDFIESFAAPDVQVFSDLEQGLKWADACYLVRVQSERHANETSWNREAYFKNYGINKERLRLMSPQSLILHPGPANLGVEMTADVYADPRCRIRSQVENGVYIRAALIRRVMAAQQGMARS